MTQNTTSKPYDLEQRTLEFAKSIIRLCQKLPSNIVNHKIIDQVIRSGGSIGANYREANDNLGKKDFLNRLRISRKEAKETSFWLELLLEANHQYNNEIKTLIDECRQLRNILSTIISKTG